MKLPAKHKDYTNSEVSGGFLFGSYAVCPECAKRMIKTIKENNEEQYIKKRCGDNQSFRNFVYEIRNNSI